MKPILLLACAALVAAGCSIDTPAAPSADARSGDAASSTSGMVPFKASWTTTSVFTGPNSFIIFGEGNATHMGRSSFEGPSQVDPATGIQTGTSTMNAADGDQLSIAYEGVTFPINGGTGVGFNGAYTFTGGTGKFLGATGGGAYEGTFSFITGTGVLSMGGEVSRPVDLDENGVE